MNEKLKAALCGDLKEYGSIPFWSWNNSLSPAELCKQIEDIKRSGSSGFIMHARTGLKDEYLGEKWFECIGACLKKARELNMEAWIYDENGWPSGFVGGKLLQNENFLAGYLEYSEGEFDKTAFATFVEDGKSYKRVQNPTGAKTYHNVYLRLSPANTDILNPAVTDAFIAETHEKYYARFKESFGKELVGFFTDEPQFYRWATPYTPLIEGEFAARGEDVRDGLIWLFKHSEQGYSFRQKYYGALNALYVNNFYKKVYDWCDAHDCKLTGHSVEESVLYGQMWGGAAVMPTYEYEHIPGIDWLGRNCGSEIEPRQVASAAAQLGKKIILTETFACSGYDVTPKELKSVAEYQYFNGVNKTCQHLYPYTLAGRGKIDHPPVFSPHSNWFEGYREFNDYFSRLGCLIGETEDYCDVALIHPVRSIWLEYIRSEDYESVKDIEQSFEKLLLSLRKRGVTFHFIDEKILSEHGAAEGQYLRVGCRKYDKIIVPDMRTLARSTRDLLQKYNGKLCVLGELPFTDGEKTSEVLRSDFSVEEVFASKKYDYCCEDGNSVLTARTGASDEFVFIKNLSSTESSRFVLKNEGFRIFNLTTLAESVFAGEMTLGPCESVILIKSRGEKSAASAQKEFIESDITKDFAVSAITENYLTLDYARIAREKQPFGEKMPVTQAFESLLREDYKGVVSVKQTFNIKNILPLKLIMERVDFISVELNGKPLSFAKSAFDVCFIEADITDALREGENELVYSFKFWQHDGVHFALFDPLATESLRNCLYYDTSIEPIYLKGDFVLNDDFEICAKNGLPELNSKLFAQGYPFFKGELTLKGKIYYGGSGAARLSLKGRFAAAYVECNGKSVSIVLDTEEDISSILSAGENAVTVKLRSGLRNLFGPHHYAPVPEPLAVGPYHFDFRGDWKNGKPDTYTHEYNFVPFGADGIILKTEK